MNKKKSFLIPICTLIIILYIILASKPLQKELHFVPAWTLYAEPSAATTIADDDQQDFSQYIPFKLGQTAGYFTSDKTLAKIVTFPYKASISKNGYVIYGPSAENTDFFAPDGKKLGEISVPGFPYFTDDKNYVFYPGGSSFSSLSPDGSDSWTFEGFSPITAFSSCETGCAAGFTNGKVVSFDNEGNIRQEYNPGGSTYEVILGIGISKSSKMIATLSGHESQRFVITRQSDSDTNSQAAVIFYKTLKNELNRQAIVKFSNDEEKVFFDSGDGLGIVNCRTMKNTMIPIRGTVLSIHEPENGNEVFVLSKEGRTYTVSAIQSFDVFAGSFSFDADCAFLTVKGHSLFIGKDSSISRIDLIQR